MYQLFLTLSTFLICGDVLKWFKIKIFETLQTVAEYQAHASDILCQFYNLEYSVVKNCHFVTCGQQVLVTI